MSKKFLKKENGSITLFVLLAILFFIIVVFNIFIVSSNKKLSQNSEIDKIKDNYNDSIKNIDQIYNETVIENLSNLLKIGDYVNYSYDTVTTDYVLSNQYSGIENEQSIKQTQNLKWQIFNIHKDGKIDLISTTPTTSTLTLKGALGYNNGVYLLNDICKKHYSNTSLGIEARNIKLEDIEEHYNDSAMSAKNSYGSLVTIGYTQIYYSPYNYYPDLYLKELNKSVLASEDGYSSPTTLESNIKSNGLTITQTYYDLDSANLPSYFTNNIYYNIIYQQPTTSWIATRCINSSSPYANFGLFSTSLSSTDGHEMFASSNNNQTIKEYSYTLRPIISLNITQIQPCTGTADGSDSTINHMHQIH